MAILYFESFSSLLHNVSIDAPAVFTGKSIYCKCMYDGQQVVPQWFLTPQTYATINANGKIDIIEGAINQQVTVSCNYDGLTASKVITFTYDNQLTIECADTMTGTSGTIAARYNSNIVQPEWTVTSGTQYANVTPMGEIVIISTGQITLQAVYQGYTATKNIDVVYQANTSSQTIIEPDGSITTETTTVTENPDGTTTTSTTSTNVTEDGFVSNTTSTLIENEDGSSTEQSQTINQDGTTSEMNKETNTDGSSTSTTTNYNASGDPTSQENTSIDTDGNNSTQNIEYDDNGDPIVTGYSIDTTDSSSGTKELDEDGVNTEFYGFNSVEGFTMDIHFTIDFTDQPPNQNENLHNILTMKRANPSPWYGFQIRHGGTTKALTFGTQFEFGSNTNTNVSPQTANWIVQNQTAEFHFHVTYDPTLFSDTFVARELISNRKIFSSSYLFPDLPELRYLTVCVGCALDENGDEYRFSKINVIDFKLEKLLHPPTVPVLAFSENVITMTCETSGAEIWYRYGGTGAFVQYTEPIEITEDVVIQTYSKRDRYTSETITQSFIYDDGIEEPTITCDGEYVEINCGTSGSDIYYRIGTSGSFTAYESPFEINATVTVQAYATIDSKQSETVSETCTYVPIVLSAPTIRCNENLVILACITPRASIYYRLNQTGDFRLYEEPFSITQNTLVEAYSMYKSQTSSTVSQNCEYTPEHDYSKDYLTFKVLDSGTISWKAFGGLTKTIEYSVNNGTWTSITSTSGGATISVVENDVVRFRADNTAYATSKSAYSGFEGGTAQFNIEGNIMSLLYGDGFASNSLLPSNTQYIFCSLFKKALVISAKNLILPATTLQRYCYRAMFSWCTTLVAPPELPATTLEQGCYWYMFEQCGIMKAPELPATTLMSECYGHMFEGCALLNTIVCRASSGFNKTKVMENWTLNVAASGTYVKSSDKPLADYPIGASGIPEGWIISDDILLYQPEISFDGETIELYCETADADIYYRLGQTGSFIQYFMPISIFEDTIIEAYSSYQNHTSQTITQNCVYVQETPYEQSNKTLSTWRYSGNTINTPFSVNRIDGHSSSYAKGTFSFETAVTLRAAQPTYLWFQHADQSADIYVDDNKVETHWGGYNAFFCDISNYVHRGTNNIKVALCNTTRSTLAPAAGDFNFNATLGNVKLFTSPCLPDMKYGYDGFHITSTVTSSSATIYVKTTVPSGASLVCTISDGTYEWSDTKVSNGQEQTFYTTISGNNLQLWNGTINPHLYNVKLEIYIDGNLYHRYERPYGFRYYSYVVNQTINGASYTGFLLNGQPYQLRGVCMHDDVVDKANALNDNDYTQEFAIIQELGCNFIRLAHYPHPKEVYDWCDQLGIVVQTEVPCVNKLQSTMPEDYYTHLTGQYKDMVEQHFNHPCIMFWGLSNETSTDNKDFGSQKVTEYTALIKSMDSERMVGYVLSHSYNNPLSYYNDPPVDWVGSNLYVGWYIDKASNNPTSAINTRINNTITRTGKALALSEYGCGGTQHCHSDNYLNTTTPGNYARHDIEYMMWIHEGHIASIRNFPQLLFTSQWQLFDVAVASRNEGYTECLDGVNTSTNNDLRRLNNKGLVERDHVTKKDPFYIYKAEWNETDKFVHICGKDYTKITDRVLKCYTNDGNSLSLYQDNSQTALETVSVTNHIATFTSRTFTAGVEYRVVGATTFDTVIF